MKAVLTSLILASAATVAEQPTPELTLKPGTEIKLDGLTAAKWIQGQAPKKFEPGKLYLFECWATWSGMSVAAIPHLNELHKKYADKGLRVFGMNVWEDGEDKVAAFVKAEGGGISYPVAYTGKGSAYENEWLRPAGVSGIPHVIIVKNGRLVSTCHPARLDDAVIEALLSGDEGVKKAVAAINAAPSSRPITAVIFEKIDANGDDTLSLKEFKATLGGKKDPAKAEAIFKKMNTNSDNKLTFLEFAPKALGLSMDKLTGYFAAPPAGGVDMEGGYTEKPTENDKDLIKAVNSGDLKAVRTLLSRGANPNVFFESTTAFLAAESKTQMDQDITKDQTLILELLAGKALEGMKQPPGIEDIRKAITNAVLDKYGAQLKSVASRIVQIYPDPAAAKCIRVRCDATIYNKDAGYQFLSASSMPLKPTKWNGLTFMVLGHNDIRLRQDSKGLWYGSVEEGTGFSRLQKLRGLNISPEAYGVDLDKVPALGVAMLACDDETACRLIEAAPKPFPANAMRLNPLVFAAYNGCFKATQKLLEEGADVNATHSDGMTPLFTAAQIGRNDIVKLLLDKGADPNKRRKDSATALFVASMLGYDDVVETLINGGADVNASVDTATPILTAAARGWPKTVSILGNAKADVNIKNKNGDTPLKIAEKNGYADVVTILRDLGATHTEDPAHVEPEVDTNFLKTFSKSDVSITRFELAGISKDNRVVLANRIEMSTKQANDMGMLEARIVLRPDQDRTGMYAGTSLGFWINYSHMRGKVPSVTNGPPQNQLIDGTVSVKKHSDGKKADLRIERILWSQEPPGGGDFAGSYLLSLDTQLGATAVNTLGAESKWLMKVVQHMNKPVCVFRIRDDYGLEFVP